MVDGGSAADAVVLPKISGYRVEDWYWVVAGDASRLWSSARAQYVGPDDAAYLAWSVAGGYPTPILSEAELEEVLDLQYPAGGPVQLATAQARQGAALAAACQAAIIGGFTSAALGDAHAYPSDLATQANQVQAATIAAGGALWCQPSGGDWAFVAHTQAQAQQVVTDFAAARQALQQRLAALTNEVQAETTVAEVKAVVW